jgi:tRNA threonylcarbamoyladenosine biosynthesis protein TsaB
MNLLAIDASCSILSVAAARGDEIYSREAEAGMKHSELVMDFINSQMEEARLKPADLDGVLCMGGPGSFTGLRIGFSIAKGLALSLSIPFAPVPTLDCAALPHAGFSGIVLPVIEARKNAFFYALFRNGERLKPDEDAAAGQIAGEIERYKEKASGKILLTGPAAPALYDSLAREEKNNLVLAAENRGYAKELISIANKRKLFDNDNTSYLYSGPEYLRKTDAEINLSLKDGI